VCLDYTGLCGSCRRCALLKFGMGVIPNLAKRVPRQDLAVIHSHSFLNFSISYGSLGV